MNLLIVEYISGGGYSNQKLSGNILSEAYGMLRNIISDFKALGHQVTTLIDSRLIAFNPPNEADRMITISSVKQFYTKIKDISKSADAVYFIGPESNNLLEKLVETTSNSDVKSLNSEINDIKVCSNKKNIYEIAKKIGLIVPETEIIDSHDKFENIKKIIKDFGYPLVIKPLIGVGCSGLIIVKEKSNLSDAISKVSKESNNSQFIAQKFIEGQPASVSVISTGTKAVSVSLNKQFVNLTDPYNEPKYSGGVVPLDHELKKNSLRDAKHLVEAFNGLKGYIGVDIILTNEEVVIMEVNPRLTTSYIGLRKIVNFNIAEAITKATIQRNLPKNIEKRGYSFFSKVQVPPKLKFLRETYHIKNIISPPFPIELKKSATALISTTSSTEKGTQQAFYRTKKRLLKIYGES
ncbi:MAG: ATP-grasp domain-containing protein [Candidatus Bathyarchaeota archaeon]